MGTTRITDNNFAIASIKFALEAAAEHFGTESKDEEMLLPIQTEMMDECFFWHIGHFGGAGPKNSVWVITYAMPYGPGNVTGHIATDDELEELDVWNRSNFGPGDGTLAERFC